MAIYLTNGTCYISHIAMSGADEVENLACTCFTCNQFKGSILPSVTGNGR